MNKITKLAVILTALTICSCNKTLDTSIKEESSIILPTSKWGSEVDNFCYSVFNNNVLPYCECKSFDKAFSTDDFGDPLLCLYCYFDSDEEATLAENEYYITCQKDGYTCETGEQYYYSEEEYCYYSYDVDFADKIVDTNLGIEIQFLCSTYNSKPCLGIFAYPYLYIEEHIYPELAIEKFLGEDNASKVPSIIDESYTYSFKFDIDYYDTKFLEVVVYNTEYTLEEAYFNALMANGFVMLDQDQEDVLEEYPGPFTYSWIYAISSDYSFGLCFGIGSTYDYLFIDFFLA